MFGFVPQVIKMFRTKIVRDLSLWMLVQFSIDVSLRMLYGIHIRNPIIVFANAITLMIFLQVFYHFAISSCSCMKV